MRAFEVSSATASRWLKHGLERYSAILEMRGKVVYPRLRVQPPEDAQARVFFDLLAKGNFSYAELGLRPREIEVAQTSLRNTAPPESEIAIPLIRALRLRLPLDIEYVGLRLGSRATWRTVIPVALELFQGQWRLHAHDLEDDGKLKSFILNRLLSVGLSDRKAPKSLLIQQGILPTTRYAITLNPLLTPDQQTVLRREMRLDDQSTVHLSDTAYFEFRRQYIDSDLTVSHDIVWPLVTHISPHG